MHWFIGALLAAGALYAAACAALWYRQDALLYFPQPRQLTAAPAFMLAREGVEIQITTRPLESDAALIYFGGNAEDVSASLPLLTQVFPDRALYLMHYRGWGESGGKPDEVALVGDALALFDHVRARHARVAVVGRSLGSGVAVQLAASRPVERLMLVTPYDSVADVASRQYPWVPVRWLLRDHFDSGGRAGAISVPTHVILAERDELIPHASSLALLGRFKPGVACADEVAGADHNSILFTPEYAALLARDTQANAKK